MFQDKDIRVKPVLRGHLRNKEIVALYDRWLLKRGSIHTKLSMTGQEKGDLLINTGDCLIEVTTWVGLTV